MRDTGHAPPGRLPRAHWWRQGPPPRDRQRARRRRRCRRGRVWWTPPRRAVSSAAAAQLPPWTCSATCRSPSARLVSGRRRRGCLDGGGNGSGGRAGERGLHLRRPRAGLRHFRCVEAGPTPPPPARESARPLCAGGAPGTLRPQVGAGKCSTPGAARGRPALGAHTCMGCTRELN